MGTQASRAICGRGVGAESDAPPPPPSPSPRLGSLAQSRAIDLQLQRDWQQRQRVIKILILGGSGSGKTTIFKQMRIVHLDGFERADLIEYRWQIWANAVEALGQLIDGCGRLRIDMARATRRHVADFERMRGAATGGGEVTDQLAQTMARIWHSSAVQQCYQRRFEIDLLDSANFMDNLYRLANPQYLPTAQDVLRCCSRTSQVQEVSFGYKTMSIHVIDVGGQRAERRKWIHLFDDVALIFFIAAISDYDLVAADEPQPQPNQLQLNVNIFGDIASNPLFRSCSIILFLNKQDIFTEKRRRKQLGSYFPDYLEDTDVPNIEQDIEFITGKFRRAINIGALLNVFLTTATDSRNIDLVFRASIGHVIKENTKSTAL